MNRAVIEFAVFQINAHPFSVFHGSHIAENTGNGFAVGVLALDFLHALTVGVDLVDSVGNIAIVGVNP